MRDDVAGGAARRAGHPQLLTGPLGVGKSVLLESIGERLADIGFEVLSVVGIAELRGMPLAALAPVLGGIDGADTGERLQHLHTRLARPGIRVTLLVDDAEHLDDASAGIILQLVRASSVRAVLTAESVSMLHPVLAGLAGEGRMQEFAVTGLDAATAADLAERRVGGIVAPASLQRLLSLGGRNPLHLRALLDEAEHRGGVSPGTAGVTLELGPLPASLLPVVASRFTALAPASRHAAELLAVAEELPSDAVAPEATVELEAAALATRSADALRLTQPLYAAVLRQLLPVDALDDRRREAAALLAHDPASRLRATTLLAESSDPPASADIVWAAAQSLRASARDRAIRLSELALSLADSRGEPEPVSALVTRADALSQSARLDDADAAFEQLLQRHLGDAELADVVSRAGFHFGVRRAQPQEAVRIAREARERVDDPAARTWLAMTIARFRFTTGEAITYAEVQEESENEPELVITQALLQLQQTVFTGQLDLARRAILRGQPIAEQHPDLVPRAAPAFAFGQFLILLVDGRAGDAEEFVRSMQSGPLDDHGGLWDYALARLRLLAGDIDGAQASAIRAISRLVQHDAIGARGPAIALLANAQAAAGSIADARATLGQLGETMRANPVTDVQASEAEARLHADAGRQAEAVDTIARAVVRTHGVRYATFAALGALTALRLDAADEVLPTLEAAASEAPEAGIVLLVRDYARALAGRRPLDLLAVAERMRAGGFGAAAADAVRHAADAAQSAGDGALTRRLAGAALRGVVAPTPAAAVGLSPREWTVAAAAAERLRNAEIAEQLGISVRTVENLLARAYRKLGISGRDELRAALRD